MMHRRTKGTIVTDIRIALSVSIVGAEISTSDELGTFQVTITPDAEVVTTATPAELDAGDESNVSAAADGGEPEDADLKQIAHEARDIVKTRFDRDGKPVPLSPIAGQLNEYEPRRVKAAIEKAVGEMNPAVLIDDGNGKYRPA